MSTARLTTERARIELANRRAAAAKAGQIVNSLLPAGSPMHFYCRLCGLHVATLREDYTVGPPPHCQACATIIAQGWSTKSNRFAEYEDASCSSCHGQGDHGIDYYTRRPRTCGDCRGKGTVKREIPETVAVAFDPDATVC